MDDKLINEILNKKTPLSDKEINTLKDLYNTEIDFFCDNNKNFWTAISKSPLNAFSQIREVVDADLYQKIELINEDSSILVDFILGCVLGPLTARVLRTVFEKLINSQFVARFFTREARRLKNAQGDTIKIIREIGDLNPLFVDASAFKKNFVENYAKKLAEGEGKLSKTKQAFDEYGKDFLQGFGEALPSSLAGGSQTNPSNNPNLTITDLTILFQQYADNNSRFFDKFKKELKSWLIVKCHEENPDELKQILKGFHIVLGYLDLLKVEEFQFDICQNSQASLLEAIYWSMMYNGRLFKYRSVPNQAVGGYVMDISKSEFEKHEYPGLLYFSEPLVGKPIFNRLIEKFPHDGNPATQKKFKDFLKVKPKEEVYAMMDEYFSLLYLQQVIDKNIMAIIQKLPAIGDTVRTGYMKGMDYITGGLYSQ